MTMPTISIVVPNYQGGATLQRTLRSLIDQQYPSLEIIVIDGGSNDDSVNIIKQYEKHLAYWVSEKDRGQSDAINKGFARCTGEVVNWLCSDDVLLPGALDKVGRAFANNPEMDVVAGAGRFVYEDHRKAYLPQWTQTPIPEKIALMPLTVCVAQAACFYKRSLLQRPRPVRDDLFYVMDVELWAYFNRQQARWHCLPDVLSEAIEGMGNKTSTGGRKIVRELEHIILEYHPDTRKLLRWQRYVRNPLQCFIHRHRKHRQIWRVQQWAQRLDRHLGKRFGQDRVDALDWRWFYLSD